MGREKTEKPMNYFRKTGFELLESRDLLGIWGDAWGFATKTYNNYIAPTVSRAVNSVQYVGSAVYESASNAVRTVSNYVSSYSNNYSNNYSSVSYANSSHSSDYTTYSDTHYDSGRSSSRRSQIANPVDAIVEIASSAVNSAGEAVNAVSNAVNDYVVKPVVEAVKPVEQAIVSAATTVVDSAYAAYNSAVSLADDAVSVVNSTAHSVENFPQHEIVEPIIGTAEAVAQSVAHNVSDAAQDFFSVVSTNVVQPVRNVITEAVSNVNQLYNQAVGYNGFSLDYHSFENGISRFTATLTDAAIGIPAKIECAVAGTVTPEKVKQAIVNFITGAQQQVVAVTDSVEDMREIVTNVSDTVVDEVNALAAATDAVMADIGNVIANDIVVPVVEFVSTAEKTIEDVSNEITSIPIASVVIDTIGHEAVGVYNGTKDLVTGVGSVALDALSVTPIGIIVAPEHAINVVDKWGTVVDTITTQGPGVIFSAIAEKYVEQYNEGGLAQAFGYAVPDILLTVTTLGTGSAAAEGTRVAVGVAKAGEEVSFVTKAVDTLAVSERIIKTTSELSRGERVINMIAKDAPKVEKAASFGKPISKAIGELLVDRPNNWNQGKWNARLSKTEFKVDESFTFYIDERIDLSGHAGKYPHINSDITLPGSDRVIKVKPPKDPIPERQISGLSGFQYGGYRAGGIGMSQVDTLIAEHRALQEILLRANAAK